MDNPGDLVWVTETARWKALDEGLQLLIGPEFRTGGQRRIDETRYDGIHTYIRRKLFRKPLH